MAPSNKSIANSTGRRKSSKPSLNVTLKLSPKLLQTFAPKASPIKEEPTLRDASSATVNPANPATLAASPNGDVPSESNSNTPIPVGPIASSSMPPPTEGIKKKGVKRGAAGLDPNAPPKIRGKPGPKKKARLEDGSIDHSGTAPRAANGTAIHKLGPKANQGAINAGLRALDRSGKPCRKWQKGGFKMKSFTGIVWELPRWEAPPKVAVENKADEQTTSGESSKENKDNSQGGSAKSEKSQSGADVEMASTPSQNVSSPAPSISTAPIANPSPAIATTA